MVTLAREPANVMNLAFWQGLAGALDELEADASVHGVIFASGLKRDIFTAGAPRCRAAAGRPVAGQQLDARPRVRRCRRAARAGNDLRQLYAPATSQEGYQRFMLAQNIFLARLYATRLATVASIRCSRRPRLALLIRGRPAAAPGLLCRASRPAWWEVLGQGRRADQSLCWQGRLPSGGLLPGPGLRLPRAD